MKDIIYVILAWNLKWNLQTPAEEKGEYTDKKIAISFAQKLESRYDRVQVVQRKKERYYLDSPDVIYRGLRAR